MLLTVGGCKQFTSCKSPQLRQVRETSKGFELKHSFCMQETVNWSPELTFSREKLVMSEEYSIAESKQTDFGFRVDAQTEDPLRPDSPCPSGLSAWPCHGWDLPCWLPAPMSQLFTWGGQSIGVSALASVLSKNTQGWYPLEWTGWISSQSKGLSRVFSNTTVQKHQFFVTQLSSQSNSQIHTWPLEKP